MSNPEKSNGRVSNEPVPTEVRQSAQRRVYTAEYKRQIVAEVTGAPRGQLAAILRRERLYSTTVKSWCEELSQKRAPGKPGRKPSAETPLNKEIERLKRENARLERKLEHAELIIDVQKKVARLIDSADEERSDRP